MNLSKTIASWDAREKAENIPFRAAEILEWKQTNNGKRGILLNGEPNRKQRKETSAANAVTDKGRHLGADNNRRDPAKRKRVFFKMAAFGMSVHDKLMRSNAKRRAITQ